MSWTDSIFAHRAIPWLALLCAVHIPLAAQPLPPDTVPIPLQVESHAPRQVVLHNLSTQSIPDGIRGYWKENYFYTATSVWRAHPSDARAGRLDAWPEVRDQLLADDFDLDAAESEGRRYRQCPMPPLPPGRVGIMVCPPAIEFIERD